MRRLQRQKAENDKDRRWLKQRVFAQRLGGLPIQGCIGSALITGMEFIVGNLTLLGWLPKMWDYSNVWLNYKGIICLQFSLIWILLSICAILLADTINYYVFHELPVPYYKLFGKTIIRFKK